MKKPFIILLLMFTTNLFAHGDHSNEGTVFSQIGMPIQAPQAKEFSLYVIVQAIKAGRLAESWMDAKIIDAKQREVDQSKDWVVSINNPAEQHEEKRTIYIFLDAFGNPYNINFTGE